MKKILIPILILPLMFFTGCSEEEETATGSSESYTISDLVGTWDTISSENTMSMNIDFVTFYAAQGVDEASLAGMTAVLTGLCADMDGTLSGYTCSVSETETICCDEGETSTLTVADNGTYTVEDQDGDGSTGTITIDGTDITIVDEGSPEMSGTLSISGTTATISLSTSIDFSDYYGYEMPGYSMTSIVDMVLEKQ